ncbi:amidohydrolase [Cellulosimicrobium funkei]|nr:amidohydrolase [Cellulosimicrobium funkei]
MRAGSADPAHSPPDPEEASVTHTPAPRTDEEVRPYLQSLGLPGLVDLHVHFMPDTVQEKVWAFFDREGEGGGLPWPIAYRRAADERVRLLDELGVTAYTTLNYAHRPGMASWLNEFSTAFAASHPRAIHSATFYPEPDGMSAGQQVSDALEAGARAFKVHVQVGGFSPLDPDLTEAWALLEQAGTPVVIHCGNGPHQGEFTGIGPVRALAELHPDLVLVIAHAGLPDYRDFAELAAEHPKVYLDTTMVGTTAMELRAPIPADYPESMAALDGKVVFGSDFPSIPYPYSHQIEALSGWGLGDEWMRNVLWNTPRRLLGY